jgi:hypothetical protein
MDTLFQESVFVCINKDPLSHNKLRKARKGSYLKSEVEKGNE